MGFDQRLRLRNEELPVVVKHPVQGFQDIGRSQIKFVQNDPVAVAHGFDQSTFLESQGAVNVGTILPKILLQVGVLVVVDSEALVTSEACQVSDQTGFAHRGLTLQKDWRSVERYSSS